MDDVDDIDQIYILPIADKDEAEMQRQSGKADGSFIETLQQQSRQRERQRQSLDRIYGSEWRCARELCHELDTQAGRWLAKLDHGIDSFPRGDSFRLAERAGLLVGQVATQLLEEQGVRPASQPASHA